MDDSNIQDLLKRDPRKAVAKILEKYGGALLGVIQRILGSKEAAEDALQDTCVKIWKNAATYDQKKGRLFTWLLNIARNTAIDKARTGKFQHHRKSQPLEDNVYDNISHSEEMKTVDVGLMDLVDNLEEKYRQVIDLIYLQGYTQKEVAESLDLPLGTVKTRARTGLRKLRKILKAYKETN